MWSSVPDLETMRVHCVYFMIADLQNTVLLLTMQGQQLRKNSPFDPNTSLLQAARRFSTFVVFCLSQSSLQISFAFMPVAEWLLYG